MHVQYMYDTSIESIREEAIVSLINKQTLSEQVYHALRQDILTQEIKCGERLTLKSLQERFQVSQTPIREALTRLADDYLVVCTPNVGVTVVNFTPKDVQEVFEFSCDLDCIAINYCLRNNDPGFLSELEEACTQAEYCLSKGDIEEWKRFSDQFHLVLFKYADNRWLEQSASIMRGQITLLSNLYQRNANVERIHRDHVTICNFLKTGKNEEAISAMRQHYQKTMAFALEVLSSEILVDSGTASKM